MRLPRQIVHATKWVDADSSRYALGGVRVGCDSGQCFAEATDGRRLVLLEWKDDADPVDVILSGKELGKAVRAAKAKDSELVPSVDPTVGQVNGTCVPVIDGRWPRSEDLFEEDRIGSETAEFTPERIREIASRVPVKIGGVTVLLSTRYLCDLADAAEAMGDGTVTLRAKDEQSQVVCEKAGKGVSLTAVIMPMAAD